MYYDYIYFYTKKIEQTLLYKLPVLMLVFIQTCIYTTENVKLQIREEEDVKYTPFIWKWKPCTRFLLYQVPHFGCPLPLHNGMNGEQQLCFYLKKNFERSLRFTCILPPAWKCKFLSSARGEARFRTTVQCAFKPPLFHPRHGEEGRREKEDQQSKTWNCPEEQSASTEQNTDSE